MGQGRLARLDRRQKALLAAEERATMGRPKDTRSGAEAPEPAVRRRFARVWRGIQSRAVGILALPRQPAM